MRQYRERRLPHSTADVVEGSRPRRHDTDAPDEPRTLTSKLPRFTCRTGDAMPTYEYECQSCHQRVEAVQRFTDPALTVCAHCGGELRKVFSTVGVVFKGSGVHKNDSRSPDKASTPTPT